MQVAIQVPLPKKNKQSEEKKKKKKDRVLPMHQMPPVKKYQKVSHMKEVSKTHTTKAQ